VAGSSKTDPRKAAALAVLVVVLVVVVVERLKPALVAQAGGGAGGGVARVGSYEVPRLGWDAKATPKAGHEGRARSLFTFGPPPTPTPDLRPTPTPPPTLPPRPAVIPTPATIELPEGNRMPPPPPFSMTFVGWLGPDRLPIAVFIDSGEVVVAPRGDTIKNRFIVRDVGPSSVTIGYVGYPESVIRKVPLSQ
jgi:hypothetical protein